MVKKQMPTDQLKIQTVTLLSRKTFLDWIKVARGRPHNIGSAIMEGRDMKDEMTRGMLTKLETKIVGNMYKKRKSDNGTPSSPIRLELRSTLGRKWSSFPGRRMITAKSVVSRDALASNISSSV